MTSRLNRFAIVSSALLALACGKDDGGTARAATPGGAGAAGGPGGRRGATITLAQADVQRVQRTTIDEGIAITGDLRPIETVDVRARIEGDLVGVYVREGERVTRGQLLARFEAGDELSERRSAEAEQVAARGALATAEWDLAQARELFTAGAIPERDVRVAEQTVATTRARLAASTARVSATSSSEADTRVVAPISGVVASRAVENGERVTRGAQMFTVVRNDVLELAAAVPAREAGDVAVGQTVRFTAGDRELQGRVARVNPTIDPASRSVTVYVQIPNPGGEIRGGTFVNGRIVLRTVPDALVVASAALRQSADGGSPTVYRISDQTLDPVTVSTGVANEEAGLVQVTKGLREGDMIVVGNVGTLGRGMKVTIIGNEAAAR